MIKKISKVGNSQGVVFDAALMEMAHLKVGDELNVEIHNGGTITLTPIRSQPSVEEIKNAIESTMEDYSETLKRLS
jgi:antitoxin component of MazEF toxin-antitoxin module